MSIRITQFVRDRHNQRKGLFDVIVDRESSENISLGWSLCSSKRVEGKKVDKFDREWGLDLAGRRRDKDKKAEEPVLNFSIDDKSSVEAARNSIPHSMRGTFDRVISRCDRIVNGKKEIQEAQEVTS